jgi:hypothetical protein
MVIKRNSAENGSVIGDGVTVTVGNSGGVSGDAFGGVVWTTTPITFENTSPHGGGWCYQLTPSSGNQCMFRTIETATDSAMVSAYFKFTAWPSASSPYISARSAAAQAATLNVTNTGRLQVQNAASAVLDTSGVGVTLALATWYRFEMRVIKGTTTTNGTIQVGVYVGDSLTPFYTYSSSVVDAGTAQLTDWRIGRAALVADTTTFHVDSVQWWTGADTPAALGKPWTLSKIAGLAATRISSVSLSLAWTNVTDAPNGYDVVRAAGVHVNDGLGRTPSDPLYDPLTIAGATVVSTADAGTPFVDTGLTPGDYTYWLVRTAP